MTTSRRSARAPAAAGPMRPSACAAKMRQFTSADTSPPPSVTCGGVSETLSGISMAVGVSESEVGVRTAADSGPRMTFARNGTAERPRSAHPSNRQRRLSANKRVGVLKVRDERRQRRRPDLRKRFGREPTENDVRAAHGFANCDTASAPLAPSRQRLSGTGSRSRVVIFERLAQICQCRACERAEFPQRPHRLPADVLVVVCQHPDERRKRFWSH